MWAAMHDYINHQTKTDIQSTPMLKQRLITTKDIARDYLKTLDSQNTMSPFLPTSQCMLIHDHTTIHGRYNTAYRDAVALPEMISYMKKKHQWQTGTADLIHWKWFKSAVRRHSHASSNHLTKLVYNQLATPVVSVYTRMKYRAQRAHP
jgi:hypothetical protein